jgi:hypothetical protein
LSGSIPEFTLQLSVVAAAWVLLADALAAGAAACAAAGVLGGAACVAAAVGVAAGLRLGVALGAAFAAARAALLREAVATLIGPEAAESALAFCVLEKLPGSDDIAAFRCAGCGVPPLLRP